MTRQTRRRTSALLTALALSASMVPASAVAAVHPPPPPGGPSSVAVADLRTNDRTDPVGVGAEPVLGWRVTSPEREQVQQAYEVHVASTRDRLEGGQPDLWDSGRVASAATTHVRYDGKPVQSGEQAFWQVRSWDDRGRVSAWSRPAVWSTGLDAGDWDAEWIGSPDWLDRSPEPVVLDVGEHTARYVRLDVTKLGLPLAESSFPNPVSRLQLAELQVLDAGGEVISAGRPVLASERNSTTGPWRPPFVTDGELTSDVSTARGYTGDAYPTRTPAKSVWLDVDLGSVRSFDRLRLFGRTDVTSEDGLTPNFPTDFTVRTSNDRTTYESVHAVTAQEPPPAFQLDLPPMPDFATSFEIEGKVERATLYASGVGIYDARLNGAPSGKGVLRPANTDYTKRVTYSTDDVTRQLRQGDNTLAVSLGLGTFSVPPTVDRYAKWTGSLGPPRLLAQLEITYEDGRTQRVLSDPTWRTRLGATVFSHWYGGEDYDARREQPGWDKPGADHSGWTSARATTPPAASTALTASVAPEIEQVAMVPAKAVAEPRPGTWIVDLGTNVAGWPELTVSGERGATVTLKPGERLNADGLVDQSTMIRGGALYPPILDHYTLSGAGRETWHPRFVYHGFRYLEVTGLDTKPTPDMFRARVLRAANDSAGTFSSSNPLIDGIHRIIDRAIQGNMYSILTDCPDREKLGWLEETHLVFGSVSRNYDVAAYYRELVQNMADAQRPNGFVPNFTPAYVTYSGDVWDDPNWGSAIIHAPWQMYRTYGDIETLRTYYPNMVRYLEYLVSKSRDGILDYGLGDWVAIDKSTPIGLTATYALLKAATELQRIAVTLDRTDDAQRFSTLAAQVGAAFNAKFLDADGGTYGSGSQASDAMALDLGVVPDEHRTAVLEHLVTSVREAGDHVTVGEVALPALFRVLSAAGRDDVVYDIANRTDHPSYGYQVVNGATALAEYWDGPTDYGSQNHFMLGAIDEWFSSGLAGIRQAEDSVAFRKLEIKPAVVAGLRHAEASYETPAGRVVSAWERKGKELRLDVEVPVGASATVFLPVEDDAKGKPSATPGARLVRVEDGHAVYAVGSGRWTFRAHSTEEAPPADDGIHVTAPDAVVPVLPGRDATARFQVANVGTSPVTVRPRVTASEGFTVQAPDRVTVAAGARVPIDVRVTRSGDTGAGTVELGTGVRSATAEVEATDNWARLGVASASSTHSRFSVAAVNDGRIEAQTDYDVWNSGEGWNDATSRAFPDTLQVAWSEPTTIGRVVLRTPDSPTQTAAAVGVRDYDVEVRSSGDWTVVDQVRGSTAATVTSTFTGREVDAVRITVLDTNDHTYSRVVELEAYATGAAGGDS